jgi:hypothetical protein
MSTQNNNCKTTIIKQNIKIILIAGVPSSQALLGYLITAPPSVCVPDVLGVLAVWIRNRKKKCKSSRSGGELYVGRKFQWFRLGLGHSSCLGFVL